MSDVYKLVLGPGEVREIERAARNAALEEAAKVADAAMLEAEDAMSDGLGAALLERTAAAIRALKGAP